MFAVGATVREVAVVEYESRSGTAILRPPRTEETIVTVSGSSTSLVARKSVRDVLQNLGKFTDVPHSIRLFNRADYTLI